jgi:hypothetical protein
VCFGEFIRFIIGEVCVGTGFFLQIFLDLDMIFNYCKVGKMVKEIFW